MDFRKADPTYTNFVPTTAADAINKFYRHKNLGVPPHLWPEVFVQCASKLSGTELSKFESWLVNPEGEPAGSTKLSQSDRENEALRKQLEEEANARDKMSIDENYMNVDDEKQPQSEDSVSSMLTEALGKVDLKEKDFEMVTPSGR